MNWKYFFTGLSLSFIMIFIITCSSDKSSPTEPDPVDPANRIIEEIEEDSKLVTTAFESGSYDQVKTVLSSNALAKYGNDLKDKTDKYGSFADALKNKKLIALGELYAEYEIEIDGIKYSVAFSKVTENGTWQLIKL
jgi:hypothetical protein